jgi:hypothetical protein
MDVTTAITAAIRPAAVALLLFLLAPVSRLVDRRMKDGRLKRLLLRQVGDKSSRSSRQPNPENWNRRIGTDHRPVP